MWFKRSSSCAAAAYFCLRVWVCTYMSVTDAREIVEHPPYDDDDDDDEDDDEDDEDDDDDDG